MPQLQDFLGKCDWTGAMTLLEFQRRADDGDEKTLLWMAYCSFHLGDYAKALDVYDEAIEVSTCTQCARCGSVRRAQGAGQQSNMPVMLAALHCTAIAGERALDGREPRESVLHVLSGPAQGRHLHRG